jgi:hypothetical protein
MNRAERRARTNKVVKKRTKDYLRMINRWEEKEKIEEVDGRCLGSFRTKHPFNCGRPGCGVCGKGPKKGSKQEDKRKDIKTEIINGN